MVPEASTPGATDKNLARIIDKWFLKHGVVNGLEGNVDDESEANVLYTKLAIFLEKEGYVEASKKIRKQASDENRHHGFYHDLLQSLTQKRKR